MGISLPLRGVSSFSLPTAQAACSWPAEVTCITVYDCKNCGPRVARMSTHAVRVKRLYRQGLKCLQNWCVHRDLYITKGFELRAEFDAQKLVTNPIVVEKLVSDGEAKLINMEHPSPYTRALPPA